MGISGCPEIATVSGVVLYGINMVGLSMGELGWLFLDLNSYFAAVEQVDDPKLIGRPVAVVPMMADTTSCLAASREAKALGIKTGTKVGEAKKICPQLILIKASHTKYSTYQQRIIKAVEDCLPISRIYSIDELACKLIGREQLRENAIQIALTIKKQIAKDIHPALTCSIGIAPNPYVAKLASDMQKPDGLTVITTSELPQKLLSLKLRDLVGVGARMEARLNKQGCYDMSKLLSYSDTELARVWGNIRGYELWHLLRGKELHDKQAIQKSISQSHVLPPELRNYTAARADLIRLLCKAARRMREHNFYCKELRLGVKLLSSTGTSTYWEAKAQFAETQDTRLLIDEFQRIFTPPTRSDMKFYRIGLTLGHLVPKELHQYSLQDLEADTSGDALMEAIDHLNNKHRKNLISYGG